MGKSCSDSSITIASWIRKLSLSLLLVGSSIGPCWGQQIERVEIIDNPRVDKDRGTVSLRVKVYDQNNRPVNGLEIEDMNLIVCDPEGECQTLGESNPKLRVPRPEELPPAWIIMLLDFSGSMKRLDSSGTTKLEGAIQAIRRFDRDLAARGANTYMAIVPFSRGGKNCLGNPVRERELKNFKLAGDRQLENTLQELETELNNLCGATDIYDPVRRAVEFLGDPTEEDFYPPEDANQPQPRLSIVLLSDGYHSIYHGQENEVEREAADFEKLLKLLKRYPDITIHTLGYGLTPQQLQAKYNLSRPPTIADVGKVAPSDFTNPNRLAQITVPGEEFVDQKRLQQIAQATGAIAEFSGNASEISENLKEFLEALLGEYEISYSQPTNADRGSEHTVTIEVNSPGGAIGSEPKTYVFPWVGPTLPGPTRLIIILSVLAALGLLGVLPFWLLARSMRQKY
ncbi:MAG: vWA domain-containing protein [Hormoscilla sp.]